MRTSDYLDALRERHRLHSDAAAGRLIGCSPASVKNYRANRHHFEDATALRVAALLQLDPAQVLTDMQAQRAASDEIRAIWQRIAERVAACLAVAAVGLSAVAPGGNARAAAHLSGDGAQSGNKHSRKSRRYGLAPA